jgi:hypothetical protein
MKAAYIYESLSGGHSIVKYENSWLLIIQERRKTNELNYFTFKVPKILSKAIKINPETAFNF